MFRPICFAALSILLALGFAPRSEAEVFVYQGVGRVKTTLNLSEQLPRTLRLYLIVNWDTGETGIVIYYVKNGKQVVSNVQPLKRYRATLPTGKKVSILTGAENSEPDPSSFHYNFFTVRGPDVLVKIATSPSVSNEVRPRVLSGFQALTGFDGVGEGTFQDIFYTLSLNPALTIDANNNNKTVTSVSDELEAKLTALGYE